MLHCQTKTYIILFPAMEFLYSLSSTTTAAPPACLTSAVICYFNAFFLIHIKRSSLHMCWNTYDKLHKDYLALNVPRRRIQTLTHELVDLYCCFNSFDIYMVDQGAPHLSDRMQLR